MKQFGGFPVRMQFTPLPNLFFSSILPEIDDIAELKTTLHIFSLLYKKKGYPRFVSYGELGNDVSLISGLKGVGEKTTDILRAALDMAVERGTILHLAIEKDGDSDDIYFLNTEADRELIDRIQSGEVVLSGIKAKEPVSGDTGEQPDIFTLYEQNIGMLTPMIAEELREAAKLYPEAWIRDAIKEAVALNKRTWRYISRILERWATEGRGDGTHRQHPSWKTDPDKYIKGPYGHLVQR